MSGFNEISRLAVPIVPLSANCLAQTVIGRGKGEQAKGLCRTTLRQQSYREFEATS